MPKVVYLTIDDFPSESSAELCQLLRLKKVPATFFCIGKNLLKYHNRAVEALQSGFILGNHSYSHPHFSKISLRKAKSEIKHTDQLLDKIYAEAGMRRVNKFFRFPYGDKGDGRMGRVFTHGTKPKLRLKKRAIQGYLKSLGYQKIHHPGITYKFYSNYLGRERDIHWTIDTLDWKLKYQKNAELENASKQILKRLFDSKQIEDPRGPINEVNYGLGNSGSDEILLLHDHPSTLIFAENLFDQLFDRGFKFGSLINPG